MPKLTVPWFWGMVTDRILICRDLQYLLSSGSGYAAHTRSWVRVPVSATRITGSLSLEKNLAITNTPPGEST